MKITPNPVPDLVPSASSPATVAQVTPDSTWLRPAGLVRLLDEDPELGRHLPEKHFSIARRQAVAESLVLDRGWWHPTRDSSVDPTDFGLLIVDGIVARFVVLAKRRTVELLGAGDLIRPAQPEADDYASVTPEAHWQVLAPTRVAVLNHDLILGIGALPGVLGELAGRAIQRSRSLTVRLAIAQVPNLEARLELLFWHLADRWGRRESGLTVLQLRLPQGLLGELACAQRTSVNAALKQLAVRGVLEQQGIGRWALQGRPPPDLGQLDASRGA